MSERAIIEDRIKRKLAEIQSLERKIESARTYLQALSDVLRAIDKAGDGESSQETIMRKGSAVARAREFILEAGVPVHIDDLLTQLGREVTREAKSSLTSSIAAYVRRQEIFTRPAPNTFGLIELGHHKLENNDSSSPPDNFGELDDISDEIPF